MEDAEEIIKYLHNKGYMLCIITNGLIELQKTRVINSGIGTFISHIIVSEEVGEHKPNPLIFNTLLERIHLRPNNVIMIGDSLINDIKGANNAKIKAIWFNSQRKKMKQTYYQTLKLVIYCRLKTCSEDYRHYWIQW